MTLIERINSFINAVASDIKSLYANKVNKTDVIAVAQGGTGATTLAAAQAALGIGGNNTLLPQKIGASQKWYQSGLRHGPEYPYPYVISNGGGYTSGMQYFVPFTALEDATITGLEIQCTAAQANATVSLGIYASDSNNDVADPLFTSAPINCNATGTKNASCNVQIKKGIVYWLSSLPIGTLSLNRNGTDSLKPIKGTTSAFSGPVIGYYTTVNTGMAQSAPKNKSDLTSYVPRVLFITA